MAYIKQNWAEMQANEIPIEAQHLEHIENGLANLFSRMGDVVNEEVTEWHDLEYNNTSLGYLTDTVDKLSLEENKTYKVIITDSQNVEAAYELNLLDAGSLVPDFAGFKCLYHGDMHTGGNNAFILLQDGYLDITNGTIIAAPGLTGILLVGYKKAIIKEYTSTTRTENTIKGLDRDYIKAVQTDFDCNDSDNIKYLKNKPFGKTSQTNSFTNFECKAVEDQYLKLDYEVSLRPGRTYTITLPDPDDPNNTLGTSNLLYYTVHDYLEIVDPSMLESTPEELYDIKMLVTEDLKNFVIVCGANPTTLTLEPGTFYMNLPEAALQFSGYSYMIEGIEQEVTAFKKLAPEYLESPDFEESNPNLGTYIKNLPLGITLTNKNLYNNKVTTTNSGSFDLTVNETPLIDKKYTIYINDIAYEATCIRSTIVGMPIRILAGTFGSMYFTDKQDFIDADYGTIEEAIESHGDCFGQFASSLPGYINNAWTVDLRIEGPTAVYRKLSSEYTPSLSVLPADKNKIKATKINGDYYIGLLEDGKNSGAISLTRDLSKLNLKDKYIADFIDTDTEKLINISEEPLDRDDTITIGSLLLSSESNDKSYLDSFQDNGPIITAYSDYYLYVLPSIPKVFKLSADGISVFADLSDYSATWQSFFSQATEGNIKLVYYGSTKYGNNRFIKIINRTTIVNRVLRIQNTYYEMSRYFESEKTSCAIFEESLDDLTTNSSSRISNDTYTFGPVYTKSGSCSSELLNTFKASAGGTIDASLIRSYYSYANYSNLITGISQVGNLCTSNKGSIYRFLDESGIEHFRSSYINGTDYTGKSSGYHSNYFNYSGYIKNLPGFSDFTGNYSSSYYLTYAYIDNTYKILVRNSSGDVLEARQVFNSPSIDTQITSKTFLFLIDNYYLLVTSNGYIYRIDDIAGQLTAKNLNSYSRELIAPPKILGNFLVMPTTSGRLNSSYDFDEDILCKFITFIPLRKTIEQKIDKISSKLTSDIQTLQESTKEVANKSMTSKITSLSSDLEIPTAKAVFDLVYPNVSKDWSHIQEVVRAGLGPTLYPVGYEFTTWDSVNQQNITWSVVGHDHHKTVDDTFTHTMTLESKYVLCDQSGNTISLAFCGKPTIFYYAKEGLPAGRYCLRGTNNYYVHYFTISKALAIPAGGCLKLAPNTGFSTSTGTLYLCNTLDDPGTAVSYSSTYTRPTVEPNANYTYLGSLANNYANDSELISTALFNNGSNNYAQSAIHQWLNSNADAGNWWTRQTVFDEAPSAGITLPGFLQSLPEDFKNVVQPVKIPCAIPYNGSVSSLDGSQFNAEDTQYELNTKFFLLSKKELNFYNAEEYDGNILEAFSETTATSRPKYNLLNLSTSAWTRTPYTNSYSVGLYSGSSQAARNTAGVAPACVIA